MATTYEHKPIEIEAIQYDGTPESRAEIISWSQGAVRAVSIDGYPIAVMSINDQVDIGISDYVIKSAAGSFTALSEEQFEATYQEPA